MHLMYVLVRSSLSWAATPARYCGCIRRVAALQGDLVTLLLFYFTQNILICMSQPWVLSNWS